MRKITIFASILLLGAFMTKNVWSESPDAKAADSAKEAAPAAEAAAPEAKASDAAAADAKPADDAKKDDAAATDAKPADDAKKDDKKAEASTEEKKDEGPKVSESPEGAKAYIISPKDGDEVTSPVKVVFGLSAMGVAPAGVNRENTGHHHLLIDKEELPAEGVPMGADVKHFGGGQTEAEVDMDPGTHTLQLILGDMNHVPHSPMVTSEKITITVK